jgi:hypothetical protein
MGDDQYPSDFMTHMPDRPLDFDISGPCSAVFDFDGIHRETDAKLKGPQSLIWKFLITLLNWVFIPPAIAQKYPRFGHKFLQWQRAFSSKSCTRPGNSASTSAAQNLCCLSGLGRPRHSGWLQ